MAKKSTRSKRSGFEGSTRAAGIHYRDGLGLVPGGQTGRGLALAGKGRFKAPKESAPLSDYGWARTELGRFDEAQPILEKAVRLAPPDCDLAANNLERLRQLRQERGRGPKRRSPR